MKVVIEGAKLTVCTECSKHGKVVYEEEPKLQAPAASQRTAVPHSMMVQKKIISTPTDTTLELVEDYDTKIRQARMKLGLSHEQLGKRINEKVSLLRKIETGKMKPNNALATRLEHTLKIKLVVPESEEKDKVPPSRIARAKNEGVTLGDLLRTDREEEAKEDKHARKQS